MKNYYVISVIILISIFSISFYLFLITTEEKDEPFFEFEINFNKNNLNKIENLSSLFSVYSYENAFSMNNGTISYLKLLFDLKNENADIYEQLKYDGKQKTIVIFSSFTASAYQKNGFYDYFRSECDSSCLTVPIANTIRTEMGGNGIQILKLLGYPFLSDVQVDKNPDILKNYDKVILVHNEYVTKNEFNAITNHPKVIYLYPNALYAEVQPNYENNTITLIRGHGYPEKDIANGFNWEFENTDPYENNLVCANWNFYEIDNGFMLNCYPEVTIFLNEELLRKIKEI